MSQAAFQRIKATGLLPSPTGVALRLIQLAADDSATIEQIAATIQTDPAISSRLLKIVNAPVAGVARTIASTASAVKLLGMRTVRNLALGHSLIVSHRGGVGRVFDFDGFWSKSLARAVAARELSSTIKTVAPDEAFTVALLSDVGRLAFATVNASEYDDLLSKLPRDRSSDGFCESECHAFGIDHCELGALMLADWHIPGLFCDAVRVQSTRRHAAELDDARTVAIARLLRVADAIACLLVNPAPFREDLEHLLLAVDEACGIAREVASSAYEASRVAWREAAAIFSVPSHAALAMRALHTRPTREYRRVLIVDDDPSCLRLLNMHLTKAGYDVIQAENGRQALRVLRNEGCRLVITDLKMPDMDGIQLCRTIRNDEGTGSVYVVLITADSDSSALSTAFDAGVDDFLWKPFAPDELLARLKAGVRTVQAECKIAAQQRELVKSNAELAVLNIKLEESATTDELTGLGNRRAAMERLREAWSFAERTHSPLTCMMIDVDHFKRVNDTYGHDVGDVVLRTIAQALRRVIRVEERVYRLGGEEFLVICPDHRVDSVVVGAERIRAEIASCAVPTASGSISATVSVGVAERTRDTCDLEAMLRSADDALYDAKRAGRNRVAVFGRVNTAAPDVRSLPPPAIRDGALAGPLRVLLADGDATYRAECRAHVTRAGHEGIEADTGDVAIQVVSQQMPDIVVVDLGMPGVNGLEWLRRLKADPTTRDIPVLVASANTDGERIAAGLQAGAAGYVTKPSHPLEFVARVETLAQSYRKTRQLRDGSEQLSASNAVRGEQARAMQMLFELARALNRADSEAAILSEIVNATAQLLLCRRVAVMMPGDDRSVLRITESVGVPDEISAQLVVPTGTPIAGRTFEIGQRFVANGENDLSTDHQTQDAAFFTNAPLASIPLSAGGTVIGVLSVTERHKGERFDDRSLEYLDLIASMAASSIDQVRSRLAREQAQQSIVAGLATLAEYHDAETGRHLERVTRYASILADALCADGPYADQIDATFRADLCAAMPLHDIGKVAVPDAILLKPGALTDAERRNVQQHARFGARAIQAVIDRAPSASFLVMAKDIAQFHHEHFDGTGYPTGLAGQAIPLAARIAAVADVYDALTTRRPYKEAMSHNVAAKFIRENAGTQFDPEIVRAFLARGSQFVSLAKDLRDGPHGAADRPELNVALEGSLA